MVQTKIYITFCETIQFNRVCVTLLEITQQYNDDYLMQNDVFSNRVGQEFCPWPRSLSY